MQYPDEVIRYYAARADVYDETAGYLDGEAEALREPVKARYRELFRDKNVLEIACGSGYWTRVLGETADFVLAVDINEDIMKHAVLRCRDLPNVRFQLADAFTLEGVPFGFDAAVAIWWYSHMPRRRIPEFLAALVTTLQPGATVMFVDQLPYEGCERSVDDNGDTVETRTLPDGRTFSVIKNFPSEAELRWVLAGFGTDICYLARPEEGNWEVVWRVKKSREGER